MRTDLSDPLPALPSVINAGEVVLSTAVCVTRSTESLLLHHVQNYEHYAPYSPPRGHLGTENTSWVGGSEDGRQVNNTHGYAPLTMMSGSTAQKCEHEVRVEQVSRFHSSWEDSAEHKLFTEYIILSCHHVLSWSASRTDITTQNVPE